MKLESFSVENYRSITKAHNIKIMQSTVLLGKNNEGKSNLLNALSVAMRAIHLHAIELRRSKEIPRWPLSQRSRFARSDTSYWDWERDYPIALQNKKKGGKTIFRLEFSLNNEEIKQFKKEIRSSLNGTLPIQIVFEKDKSAEIKVIKRGPYGASLNTKSDMITQFINKRISFNYIPAIRTHKQSLIIIEDLLSSHLKILEKDTEYQKAVSTIDERIKPLLKGLAEQIKKPLSEFLPDIRDVKIYMDSTGVRHRINSDFQVVIDDGTPTNIEFKGDGVKSLAALGLLKNRTLKDISSIIAIEEPESHLHPGAIHQLQKIITSLEEENQVVVTTHNPLFVNRSSITSNIVVEDGKARQAKNIQDIRNVLGVKVSDNLINSQYALIVEGENDKIILESVLPSLSKKISDALRSNVLTIWPLKGANNLPYFLSLLDGLLCSYHVFVDNDKDGKGCIEKSIKNGTLEPGRYTLAVCSGLRESEIEDCIDTNVYAKAIKEKYNIDVVSFKKFKRKQKWSDRVKDFLLENGDSIWSDEKKAAVKEIVASSIKESPAQALDVSRKSAIESLVKSLEEMIA